MAGATQRILRLYALASNGQQDAYAFLLAWHGWCHAIDDHVDEAGRPADVVDLCADAAVLFSSAFYQRFAASLAPVVAVVAAKYRASLELSGILQDVLRVAGNDMVLAVAYLTGGQPTVRAVSRALWPIVEETQFKKEAVPVPA